MTLCKLMDGLEVRFNKEVAKHGQCGGFAYGEFEDYVNNMELYELLNKLMEIEQEMG